MKKSISAQTKSIILTNPVLFQALKDGLLDHTAFARKFAKRISEQTGKQASQAAIVMALRRIQKSFESIEMSQINRFDFRVETQDNLFSANYSLSRTLNTKLNRLEEEFFSKGLYIALTYGENAVSVIIQESNKDILEKTLEGEELLSRHKRLVSISAFFDNKFQHTTGVIAKAAFAISAMGINILEIVSTFNELTVFVNEEDAADAYNSLLEIKTAS